jgi:ProP effector
MTGDEAMAKLMEQWPRVFADKDPRPLKIGIFEDIVAAKTTLSSAEIKAGIACYCGRPRYFRALVAGAQRIDLEGNSAGEVTHDQADLAKEKFWRGRRRGR